MRDIFVKTYVDDPAKAYVLREFYNGKLFLLYTTVRGWASYGLLGTEITEEDFLELPNRLDDLIMTALGYSDPLDFVCNYREETDQTLDKLTSNPAHGFALFKMLLARNGDT